MKKEAGHGIPYHSGKKSRMPIAASPSEPEEDVWDDAENESRESYPDGSPVHECWAVPLPPHLKGGSRK